MRKREGGRVRERGSEGERDWRRERNLRAPKEIFAVPACMVRRGAIDRALAAFYFHESRPIHKNRKILHHVKVSYYSAIR